MTFTSCGDNILLMDQK